MPVVASVLDRLPTNKLMVTQELIATMLGVRREGVTAAAGRLQKLGVIEHVRGQIAVLDRPAARAALLRMLCAREARDRPHPAREPLYRSAER